MPIAGPRLLGRQEPQHLLVPPAYSNAAVETIELYESLGPTLDPWQKLSLHSGLGEDRFGAWVAFIVALLVQRQNGKGGVAEARIFGGLFLFGDPKIIYSAHRVDTAMGTFKRVKNLIDGSDDLTRRIKRIVESAGEASIETMSGQLCEFRTRGRDGGRGLSAATLFLDEALEMALEVMADLLPTLLAIEGAQVWITSTPPKFDGQYLTQLRRRALAGESERTAYLEWSNPQGADLRDPKVLAAVNPALGIRLTLEKLQDLRRELGDALFARECGGIWPTPADAEWLVIPEADWTAAQVPPTSQIVGRPALGVYVPPDRSYSAIAAAGAREEGGRQIEVTGDADTDVIDFRPGTRWIVPRLKEMDDRHDLAVIVVDDKAVAEECEAAGLEVHRASPGDVVTGCGLLYDGIAGPDVAARDVHHIGQPELTDAAAGAVQRNVGNSWAWDRRAATVDISTIGAASLALFGHATPRVQRPESDGFNIW
ncbi:phage terminase [Actinoplanes sp. N902-109]|uniref:phage terminase n=1 Tax=Actinoplanes sp. (strain N902-109) TaxID=649831 RepID=UPI00032950E8|nr:phage terminase [Actinoplanes sp. N902-109]AGL19509.1 phage terminase [Actinoplanes sp. N902-109]